MADVQYKDNAASLLTGSINNIDDPATFSITAGTGAKFPALTGSQWFPLIAINASGQYEKMKVTARSTDSLTAARAQGGTTKIAFAIGDAVFLPTTKEFFDEILFEQDAQAGAPFYCGAAAGTANAITLSATPTVVAYAGGLTLVFKAAADNTAAVDVNVDSVGSADVKHSDGSELAAGDIQQDGVYVLIYTGSFFELVNPLALRASGGTMTGPIVLSGDAPFDLTAVAIPECGRLEYNSATSIKLNPYRGNRIAIKTVAGRWQLSKIPSAGTELLTTALTSWDGSTIANDTTYYIYAYDNAGTLTIEASTTAFATDTDTGLEIKTGDATRRLVGMCRSNGVGQITHTLTPAADTSAKIGVISRLNRRAIVAYTTRSASLSRTATSITELSATLAIQILTWADEAVCASAQFRASLTPGAEVLTLYGYIDGASAGPVAQMQAADANYEQTLPLRVNKLLAAGYHEYSPYYTVSSGATATVHAQDANVVQCEVMG